MLRILQTNDFHGTLEGARFERLKKLREEADLYFDCGDGIKTGNLGVPLKPEPIWERLHELEVTASVLGNRETHVMEKPFEAKLAGHRHPILVANLFKKDGTRPLESHRILEAGGLRVGVFGVMVAMVTERMSSKALSSYLWSAPVPCAVEMAAELRPHVDLVIALTHIGYKQDLELASRTSDIDIILGGHSHTVLGQPEKHGNAFIAQTGSHGRFAGLYDWDGQGLTGKLVPIG